MAAPLLQHVRTPPRPRLHPADTRPTVHVRPGDPQGIPIQLEVVLRVGRRGHHDLRHRPRGAVRREPQDRQRVVDALPLDQRHHRPDLRRRDPHVPRHRLGFHAPPPYDAAAGADGAGAAAGFTDVVFSTLAPWLLNVRVAANSPSLCPTMFSVTYTGTCFRPSYTAMVCPTISGTTVERRDHVRITRRSRVLLSVWTFANKCASTNGPFFTDRPIYLRLPIRCASGVRPRPTATFSASR